MNPSEVELRDSQLIDKEVKKRIHELEEVPTTITNTQLGTTMPVYQVQDNQLDEDESVAEDNITDLPRRSKRTPVKRYCFVSYTGWIGEEVEKQYQQYSIFLRNLDTLADHLMLLIMCLKMGQ